MKNASEWFRWLTPILLGLLSASNARIHGRMDKIEEQISAAMEKSAAYTDKVAAPLSKKIEEHAKEIVDIRVDVAKFGRRWRPGAGGGER